MTLYLPAISLSHFTSLRSNFLSFLLLLLCGITHSSYAQKIIINGGNLVSNGKVFLVVNDMAFQNNGIFTPDSSTVKFSGSNDTLVSYISGASITAFNNLTVSKSVNGAKMGLALKSAAKVTNVLLVSGGNLYTDSNLTLRSVINLTARVDQVPATSNIFGKAMVERYIPTRRSWRLMTAPVTSSNTIFNSWQNGGVYSLLTAGLGALVTGPNPTGALGNGLDPSLQNNSSLKGWDYNTQLFTPVLNTKVAVSPGVAGSGDNKGYFIFIRGDRNAINTTLGISNITTITSIGALQTGPQTFPASSVSGKYTMVGNPYASPVDFNKVTLNNLTRRFYVWDPYLNLVGGYVVMDDVPNTGTYMPTPSPAKQTNDIQSSQAIFVQTNASSAASIVFNESSKSGGNNNTMFRPSTGNRPAGVATGQITASLNLLNADNSTILADGVKAQFANIFDAGIDLDDAAKFTNSSENFSIVRNNVLLSIERRPEPGIGDTIFLRLTTTTKRNYQFVFEATGLQQTALTGYLEDSYLGTSAIIQLAGSTTINFAIDGVAASAAVNRFRIVFKQVAFVLPVTISSVTAHQKNNGIAVEWKVENEINMVKYDVEKSRDGAIFTRVNTTNVAGTNNAYNTYSWLDVNAVQGNNFYRIKSYDNSGAIKYSSIVKVEIGKSGSGFSIYPNPVTGDVINLVMNNQPAGRYELKLTNAIGQVIFVKTIQNTGGNGTQSLKAGSKLVAGVYQLEITGQDNNLGTERVVVE